jgi:DNA-nicking Smr family endonuclease
MLHVFDDCAHEHYQRTLVVTGEGHNEHSITTVKRKVAINQRVG